MELCPLCAPARATNPSWCTQSRLGQQTRLRQPIQAGATNPSWGEQSKLCKRSKLGQPQGQSHLTGGTLGLVHPQGSSSSTPRGQEPRSRRGSRGSGEGGGLLRVASGQQGQQPPAAQGCAPRMLLTSAPLQLAQRLLTFIDCQ